MATRERQEADRQREIAQENYRRARDTVDKYLTRVSAEPLLLELGLQPLRKDLLELALDYYRQFAAEQRDDSNLQKDLADAYVRVGEITSETGQARRITPGLQYRKGNLQQTGRCKPRDERLSEVSRRSPFPDSFTTVGSGCAD